MHRWLGVSSLLLLILLPVGADAARLWSSGCELQVFEEDGTDGAVEWNASGSQAGALSISTTIFRSGLASCRINTTAGNYEYGFFNHATGASTNSFYARVYVYIASTPGATTQFMTVGTASEDEGAIGIGTDMVLRLYTDDMSTVRDTAASALSTGTWYRIEWNYDAGGTSEVRVDGVQVLEDATHDGDGIDGFVICSCGINFGGAAGNFYFDDFAVNDTSGGSQNSWPGAGSIVHMQPNAAGDINECHLEDYTYIDEVTPDDLTTECELGSPGGAETIDVNVESADSAGIPASVNVTLVQVGIREQGETSSTAQWQTRVKAQASGTVSSGTATTHNDTTYKTNGDATPRNYTLTAYVSPETSSAWTRSELDTMQIGVTRLASSNDTWVSTLWALVEYTESAPAAGSITRGLFNTGRTLRIVGGGLRIL